VLLDNGDVLVEGGTDNTSDLSSAELLRRTSESWFSAGNMSVGLRSDGHVARKWQGL